MSAAHPRPHPRGRRTSALSTRKRQVRTLSRELIVDTAMEVLDAEGLDAVTMRAVADRLGTGPASLYAHVEHKDDLVAALMDRVIGEFVIGEPPDPERWQEQLKHFAREARRIFNRHRDIARASIGHVPTGPNGLPVIEWMLSVMIAGGVPDQVAAWAADIVSLFVTATSCEEAFEAERLEQTGMLPTSFDGVVEVFQALDPVRFPTMVALTAQLAGGDGDDRFEFGLDMLVRGIASTIDRPLGS